MAGKILIDRLAHCRYGHPDIELAKRFFLDFGLVTAEETDNRIWMRGFGKDPFVYVAEKTHDGKRRFLGGGWIVQSLAELDKATELPGATPIRDYEGPGGGKYVIMTDIMGEEITLIYGQTDREPSDQPQPIKWNTWETKTRNGEFQRPDRACPSKIHKLGHYGFEVDVKVLPEVVDWYCDTFNFAKTDSLRHEESGNTIMTFIHIDKGKEYVDHHVSVQTNNSSDNVGILTETKNIFIAGGPIGEGIKAHHSSFEVDDMDSQLVGHHHLHKQGWINVFGVGRHVLGSQIFDYW